VIEDNAWGISVSKRDSTAVERNSSRALAYGIPGVFVQNNDVDEIYSVAAEAVRRARRGGGPSLIEIETCRLEGHFMGDAEGYRPQGEVERLKSADPIVEYRKRLLGAGIDARELDAGEQNARREVEQAIAFARSAPAPQVEEALEHVFA
jgi:TPP-dependent pyruvate/acetoin dehydrogenase alpha subunit